MSAIATTSPGFNVNSDQDDYTNTSGAGTSPTSGTSPGAEGNHVMPGYLHEADRAGDVGFSDSVEFEEEQFEVLMENVDRDFEPPEEQILQYAEFLGFDMEVDQDLFWIARDGLKDPFPQEWKILRHVETQKIMYLNTSTGETSEEDPRDAKYKSIFELEKHKKLAGDEHQLLQGSASEYRDSSLLQPSSSSPEFSSKHIGQANGTHERLSKPTTAPMTETPSTLHTSSSFRHQNPSMSPYFSVSPSTPSEAKSLQASSPGAEEPSSRPPQESFQGAGRANITQTSTSSSPVMQPLPPPPIMTGGPHANVLMQMRSGSQRSLMSEDDVETIDDESVLMLRRYGGRLGSDRTLKKQDSTESILLRTGSSTATMGHGDTATPSSADNSASAAGSQTNGASLATSGANASAGAGGSSAAVSSGGEPRTKESRESRHRETIRRIEAEITILREDIVETRKYADAAAARAQEAHAERIKAEARARLAEEEHARLRNELETAHTDSDRRRLTLKKELDDTIQRLLAAEDARDAAERRSREILMEESARVKHMEREMEAVSGRLAKALRDNEALASLAELSRGSSSRSGINGRGVHLPSAQSVPVPSAPPAAMNPTGSRKGPLSASVGSVESFHQRHSPQPQYQSQFQYQQQPRQRSASPLYVPETSRYDRPSSSSLLETLGGGSSLAATMTMPVERRRRRSNSGGAVGLSSASMIPGGSDRVSMGMGASAGLNPPRRNRAQW